MTIFRSKLLPNRLFDNDVLVQIAAAEALAEFGNISASKDLYKALDDESPLVRSFIAEAIGSIGSKSARPFWKSI